MTGSSTSRRPLVLLLAGEVRDDWTRALEAGGLEVATTGWLDGITAARHRRPDLLLVSTDLPEGAARSVLSAFRSAVDLYELLIVVAGPGAKRLDDEQLGPSRADRYLPEPTRDEALAGSLHEAIRVGRATWRQRPGARIVVGLMAIGLLAMVAGIFLEGVLRTTMGSRVSPTVEWILFGVFVAALVAAIAVALKTRERPLSIPQWRTHLAWGGMLLWNGGSLVPGHDLTARFAGAGLGCVAWAAWAWLGPQAKPRTRGARRAFHFLAGALILLGLAPWIVMALAAPSP
jgi:CheY-like chemotaxis protein